MSQPTVSEEEIWAALDTVKDPEIPVISVVDMGIVREVKIEGGAANITMSPTFVGCPAIDFMQQSIKKAVIDLGYEVVNVKVDMNLVWSTNLLTEKGKQQLKEFGLAPPRQVSETGVSNKDLENVECPNCGSTNTSLNTPFGPTLCRAIHFCKQCNNAFQQFKPV